MQKFIVIAIFISVNAAAETHPAPYNPCNDDLKIESTLLHACNTAKRIHKLENKLQIYYKKSLTLALSPGFLVTSHRKWTQFLEANCSMEQEELGGTESINYLTCRERMTSERIKYLKEFFALSR